MLACAARKQRSTASRANTGRDPSQLREDLPKIFQLIGREEISPLIAATFDLLEARQALLLLATGRVEGKLVLTRAVAKCAGQGQRQAAGGQPFLRYSVAGQLTGRATARHNLNQRRFFRLRALYKYG